MASDLSTLKDEELAKEIRVNDKEARDLAEIANNTVSQSLERVIIAGNALLAARGRCSHGEWGPWQKRYLPDIPPSRISRYIAVAKQISHVRNLDAIQSVRQLYLACGLIKEPDKSSQVVKLHKFSGRGSIEGILTQAQETRKSMRLFLTKNKAESLSMETKSQLRMELRELVEILRLLTDGGIPDPPNEAPGKSDE